MKKKTFVSAFIIALLFGLQGCSIVGGIFKAGTATGIIICVGIIALIIFVFAKIFKK